MSYMSRETGGVGEGSQPPVLVAARKSAVRGGSDVSGGSPRQGGGDGERFPEEWFSSSCPVFSI